MRLSRLNPPEEIKDLELEIGDITRTKDDAAENQQFEEAARLRDHERALKSKLEERRQEWESKVKDEEESMEEPVVEEVIEMEEETFEL